MSDPPGPDSPALPRHADRDPAVLELDAGVDPEDAGAVDVELDVARDAPVLGAGDVDLGERLDLRVLHRVDHVVDALAGGDVLADLPDEVPERALRVGADVDPPLRPLAPRDAQEDALVVVAEAEPRAAGIDLAARPDAAGHAVARLVGELDDDLVRVPAGRDGRLRLHRRDDLPQQPPGGAVARGALQLADAGHVRRGACDQPPVRRRGATRLVHDHAHAGYSFLGGLKRVYSPALESGTITPFCSGSGCLVQRDSTRRAARLPAARWSASAWPADPRVCGRPVGGWSARPASLAIGDVHRGRGRSHAPIVNPRSTPARATFPTRPPAIGYGRAACPLVVDVPLNTAIADLDEALRQLLRRELERHGFDGVEIAFDAPSKEWSGKLTSPTVDLFLYDLREAVERAERQPTEMRGNGAGVVDAAAAAPRADLRGDRVDAGGRGRAPAALAGARRSSSPTGGCPPTCSTGALDGGALLAEAETSVGRPREEKADFWTSVGGQYKASIDFVVHIAFESGAAFVRGPEVRTQTLRTRLTDGPRADDDRVHRIGGTVARRRRASRSPTRGSPSRRRPAGP